MLPGLITLGVAVMFAGTGGLGAQQHSMPAGHAHDQHGDSAFAALQARGQRVMGVDQYASRHHFDDLGDGGRIQLQAKPGDPKATATIREHQRGIARAFSAGDFSDPMAVHDREVLGSAVMAAKKDAIRYSYHDLPRGGEVRIRTADPEAIRAVHELLAFQRGDHRAPGRAAR
jgi:hypothetical protein